MTILVYLFRLFILSFYAIKPDSYCIYSFFFKEHLFIYLLIHFLAVLGLRCCMWACSSCGERGLLFVVVCGLLIAVASRCGARALGTWASVVVARGLSSCGSQALELRLSSCGTWA